MALFKKRPDTFSITMQLVEAHAKGDANTVAAARDTLSRVSTLEILQCVLRFGQIVGAKLQPEAKEVVRRAYASVTGPPEIQRAVNEIGVACFLVAQQDAVTTAVNTYMAPLVDSPADAVRRVVLEIVAATGQACGQLDMNFNWK
jgi:hypothetical protein